MEGGWRVQGGVCSCKFHIYMYNPHQFSICNGCAACVSIVGVQCATCR